MSFVYWLKNLKQRCKNQSVRNATIDSTHELYIGFLRRLEDFQNPDYESHWDRDWDILCILDACRVDLFRNACADYDWLPVPEQTDVLYSTGSTSREWMQAMFGDDRHEEMQETAYITGNLFVEHINTEPFAHLDIFEPRLIDDPPVYTVPPSDLTDAAIRYWRDRDPDVDRLIVHYMQPHTPFRSHPEWFDAEADMAGNLRTGWGQGFPELRDGDIDREEFVAAYRDNLDWVLGEVDRLRQNANATLALSADHGNGLGERAVYGHPEGINISAVREVPFATIDATDTHECTPDAPSKTNDVSETTEKKLRRLGYMT